jgi:hypothetical protein
LGEQDRIALDGWMAQNRVNRRRDAPASAMLSIIRSQRTSFSSNHHICGNEDGTVDSHISHIPRKGILYNKAYFFMHPYLVRREIEGIRHIFLKGHRA